MTQGTSFERSGFALHPGDSGGSQFIIAAQRRDPAAFRELVHSYDAMVMRIALALTGSKDSAQEIYFRVFRDAFASMNKLDCSTSVFVWLYRILVKHCIGYCRRNRSYLAKSESHSLVEVLHGLPPTERVIFLLKHSQWLKICTIAEIIGSSPERIASVLQSATTNLRAQLKSTVRQIA
jgi:DNA-directed RNA polymerase specialized sigma24 family protein